jgi:hypothetical protein
MTLPTDDYAPRSVHFSTGIYGSPSAVWNITVNLNIGAEAEDIAAAALAAARAFATTLHDIYPDSPARVYQFYAGETFETMEEIDPA